MQYFISQISDIVSSSMMNRHNIIAQDLYNLTNERLGFIFDYRVCDVPDFYQFLIYYCHQIINLQFINGTFVAFPKHVGYMPHQCMNNHYMINQSAYCQNNQMSNNRAQYYGNSQVPFTNQTNSNYYSSQYAYNYPDNK